LRHLAAPLAITLLGGPSIAVAGTGPWVVGSGQASLYTGVESQRLTKLAIQVDGERDVIDVGQGISSFGVKAIGSLGITDRVEVELGVPWWSVRANRPDEDICAALGLSACDDVQTVGVITARTKALLLDEYFGAPVSLSLGAELRYGDFTADTRARITNVGEGTNDIGPTLAIGRIGSFGGNSFASAYVEAGWRYRFPTTRAYPDAPKGELRAPQPETWFQVEAMAGPNAWFAIGPSLSYLTRAGLDWGELDLSDPDRLAALAITTVRVGGGVVVRGDKNLALSASVLGTAFASNNPTDVLSVNLGVSFSGLATNGRK
jgi:hypothetical protein